MFNFLRTQLHLALFRFYGNEFGYFVGGVYIITSLAFGIFYIITAIRIIVSLTRLSGRGSKDDKTLMRVTIKLLICGCCHVGLFIESIFGITDFIADFLGGSLLFYFGYILTDIKAGALLIAFE